MRKFPCVHTNITGKLRGQGIRGSYPNSNQASVAKDGFHLIIVINYYTNFNTTFTFHDFPRLLKM